MPTSGMSFLLSLSNQVNNFRFFFSSQNSLINWIFFFWSDEFITEVISHLPAPHAFPNVRHRAHDRTLTRTPRRIYACICIMKNARIVHFWQIFSRNWTLASNLLDFSESVHYPLEFLISRLMYLCGMCVRALPCTRLTYIFVCVRDFSYIVIFCESAIYFNNINHKWLLSIFCLLAVRQTNLFRYTKEGGVFMCIDDWPRPTSLFATDLHLKTSIQFQLKTSHVHICC